MTTLEKITTWYHVNTIDLINKFLYFDNINSDEYMSIILKRIELYIDYLHDPTMTSVMDYLIQNKFDQEDTQLFLEKYQTYNPEKPITFIFLKQDNTRPTTLMEIIVWYEWDFLELLDLVLHDDEEDPQYSAVTTAKKIELYLDYKREPELATVQDYLIMKGYSSEEIALFNKKYEKEFPHYHTLPILEVEG